MTLKEIYQALAASGYSVTYYQWPEKAAPALPYICYYVPTSDNFGADDVVYSNISRLYVELYTAEKNPTAEGKVETALAGISGYWNKSETFLDTENMFQTLYESEVLLSNGQ